MSSTTKNNILEENVNDEEIIINRKDIVLNTSKIDKDLLGNFPTKPIRIGTINKGGQGERAACLSGGLCRWPIAGQGYGDYFKLALFYHRTLYNLKAVCLQEKNMG